MPSDYESVYSPETDGIAAGERQLTIARNEFAQQMIVVRQQVAQQQAAVDAQRQELARARARVREEEAENWRVSTLVKSQRANLENEAAVVKRDRELVAQRDAQLKALENLRRRNRTVSTVFIEDNFGALSPRAVVENLTNSSLKIRKHAMDNVSACIGGSRDAPPTFVRFTPQDIAPDILPKLHQLVSSSGKPLESILDFVETVVSAPPIASALAHAGQCSRLADYLIEANQYTSALAIRSLRCMVGMDTSVVKPAYEALSLVIPHIPTYSSDQPPHPAVDFIVEVAPKIIEDCFNNGLWLSVAPLVGHRIPSIRKGVLRKIILLAQHSDRTQHGLVESHIIGLLDPYYQTASPPFDVVEFFTDLLPLIVDKLCRDPSRILWLLARLGDPSAKIQAAVISAFRGCLQKQDPTIMQMFVVAHMLQRLDEPPTQQSFAITKLICQMLPILAIPYARAQSVEGIVSFLDHGDSEVANASLMACVKIVGSTLEDRSHLYAIASKLNFAKESTLKLFDHAMPAFCKDWANSGELNMIVQFIQHPERRLRHSAQRIWGELVSTSPAARSKIAHDGLLDVIFELCHSQYDDAVLLGAKCCSPMALEFTQAGVASTRQLVELLNHPNALLRQAALRGVQVAAEGNDQCCKVLLDAEVFKALCAFFETYPKDLLDNAHKILARLTPFLHASPEACISLLQLLESTSPAVERSARMALTTISNMNITHRTTLRGVVLDRIQLPTDPLIEFASKAIHDWIGPDLALVNDFETLFGLVFHSDRRIQTSALISLRRRLSNVDHQDSLEKANIVFTLRSLSISDNPEALNFVAYALRTLALSLARNGHARVVMNLLEHNEPKVRDGAIAALEVIASGSVQARKALLEEDLVESLVGHDKQLEQTLLHVLAFAIPKLAFDYVEAGKADVLLTLVDHPQQQIRTAATKSVAMIASGTTAQKVCLRDALLPRLAQASPVLREVAASCLSRSLASDLVADGDFIQVFQILHSEDYHVREPVLHQLQTFIQASDEAARRRLVDAGILQELLLVYTPAKDDVLALLVNCALPILGPSFTVNNGGATLFPLLQHAEPRLRSAAVQALRNAIDSRHGNMDNLAKASVVGTLHVLTVTDDTIRDLWCRMVPKVAPFLVHRTEVDLLFECLSDTHANMREAAYEALSSMVKSSETTRSHLFPSLLARVEDPTAFTLPLVALAVSMSGSVFVLNNKEGELLDLVLHGHSDVATAAVEATVQLLAKGSSFEHQQLMKAQVFNVAFELYQRQLRRQLSLKLLHAIITHLSYAVMVEEPLAREMFSLFDDPDPSISSALYQSWTSDPRIYGSHSLPEFLPLLFEDERLRNPSVTALLRQLATHVTPNLVTRRRLDILVQALMVEDVNVIQAFLHECREFLGSSTENEKDWFAYEPYFVSTVGMHLKGRNATTRRSASMIVQLLSKGSASRSGKIMNEGIGRYLSEVAVNGEKGAQHSSLEALLSLFMAAPDHAERLVDDCLPALRDILEEDNLSLSVHIGAFRLLYEIVQQSSHSAIIKSGISADLVRWLSPRHNVADLQCRQYNFNICEMISQQSDFGRKSLIDEKILLELENLATSRSAMAVIGACKILKALAHSGTFKRDIVSAGLKKTMKKITSPFQKSTLQNKEDKLLAQTAAKEVLQTLDSLKRLGAQSLSSSTSQQGFHHPPSSARNSLSYQEVEVDPSAAVQGLRRDRNSLRRTTSESHASDLDDSPSVPAPDGRHIGHARSLSEMGPRGIVSRSLRARQSLSATYGRRHAPSGSALDPTVEEDLTSMEPTSPGIEISAQRNHGQSIESTHSPPVGTSLRRYDATNGELSYTRDADPNNFDNPLVAASVERRRFDRLNDRDPSEVGSLQGPPPTYRSMSIAGQSARRR